MVRVLHCCGLQGEPRTPPCFRGLPREDSLDARLGAYRLKVDTRHSDGHAPGRMKDSGGWVRTASKLAGSMDRTPQPPESFLPHPWRGTMLTVTVNGEARTLPAPLT